MSKLTTEENLGKINVISTAFSEGVENENIVTDKMAEEHSSIVDDCDSPSDYYTKGMYLGTTFSPIEYKHIINRFLGESGRESGEGICVLDIGVGRGESSVFLADNGFTVYSIEPGNGFCELLSSVVKKFGLAIHIYRSVAEDIEKLQYVEFDLIIFNSSLHHCDDPDKALKNCYSALKPEGKIYLSGELSIRLPMTKTKFYRLMEESPDKVGHYGGNEHVYYNWEYLRMLREAGFQDIQMMPMWRAIDPLLRIEIGLRQKIWPEKWFALRVIYFFLIKKIASTSFLFCFLAKTSLIPANYMAKKT